MIKLKRAMYKRKLSFEVLLLVKMYEHRVKIINHLENLNSIPFINIVSRSKNNHAEYVKQAWNLTALEKDLDLICPNNISPGAKPVVL
jgi:hypothetical protein